MCIRDSFGIAFAAFFFGYRLTPKKMEQIAVDLAAREAEKGAAAE